jgi:tRNA uridine 5-carboxymethylaminomethyl modification enzyme
LVRGRRDAETTRLGAATIGRVTLPVGSTLADALRRPDLGCGELLDRFPGPLAPEIAARVEIELKMDGYVRRQAVAIARAARDEAVELPADLDYAAIRALSREAREKLDRARPRTLGAAFRIPGMTPADVALLSVHVHRRTAVSA